MRTKIENWCWNRLLPDTEEQIKLNTPFEKLYPANKKFEAITMASRDVIAGFHSF
jgi:hypothetical protein